MRSVVGATGGSRGIRFLCVRSDRHVIMYAQRTAPVIRGAQTNDQTQPVADFWGRGRTARLACDPTSFLLHKTRTVGADAHDNADRDPDGPLRTICRLRENGQNITTHARNPNAEIPFPLKIVLVAQLCDAALHGADSSTRGAAHHPPAQIDTHAHHQGNLLWWPTPV